MDVNIDVSIGSTTIAHYAALEGNYELFHYLAESNKFDMTDVIAAEALKNAILFRQKAFVSQLVSTNFNFNILDSSEVSPLHTASSIGNIDAMSQIILAGAKVNISTKVGTPLYLAAKLNKPESVLELFLNGANLHILSPTKKTPLDVARRNKNTDVVRLLEFLHSVHARKTLDILRKLNTVITQEILNTCLLEVKNMYDLHCYLQLLARAIQNKNFDKHDPFISKKLQSALLWPIFILHQEIPKGLRVTIAMLADHFASQQMLTPEQVLFINEKLHTSQSFENLHNQIEGLSDKLSQLIHQSKHTQQYLSYAIEILGNQLQGLQHQINNTADKQADIANKMLSMGKCMQRARYIGAATSIAQGVVGAYRF